MNDEYELWDTDQDTLIGMYPTMSAALAVIRIAMSQHGEEAVAAISLGHEVAGGDIEVIAAGKGLVEMAFRDGRNPGLAVAV